MYEYDSQAQRSVYGYWILYIGWIWKPPPETKRVMIDFLKKEDFDIKKILCTFSMGIIPKEWKVIVEVVRGNFRRTMSDSMQ